MREAGVDSGVYYPRLAWDYDVYRDHPASCLTTRPGPRRRRAMPFAAGAPGLGAADLERVAEAFVGALQR